MLDILQFLAASCLLPSQTFPDCSDLLSPSQDTEICQPEHVFQHWGLVFILPKTYYKAKYLQSVLNYVKDKQIRDVEIAWDEYAGKDRNVGGEMLYIWRFKDGENTDYEVEHFPAYFRESNEKDVIKWKNTFHSRTSNCIFISCRTTGILLFPQQNLQQILFPHELFSCINFYNIALMIFFLLQLYRQCWWTGSAASVSLPSN